MSLIQFPVSRLRGAYQMTSNRQWHYAERYAVAAVEYCCYSVFRKLGAIPWSLLVMDCSTSTGGTPEGRHPAGSHNNGVNLDLGYYGLVDLRPYGLVPGPHNGSRMTGPPNPRLFASQAEVEWFLAMGRLEVDIGEVLIRLCATDPYIEPYLDPKIQIASERPEVVAEALRICYSSNGGGWEVYHHHHRHIRFNRMRNGDEIAAYIETAWIQPLLQARPIPVLIEDKQEDDAPDAPIYPPSEIYLFDETDADDKKKEQPAQ